MTPDAVEALHGVAEAVDGARAEIAGLSVRWAEDLEAARVREDQRFRDIRHRENARFRTVNRTLAIIVAAIVLALFMLGFVVWQSQQRAETATLQRRCSDIVTTDVLGRLSILAVQPRFRTNAAGEPILDDAGHPIVLTQVELLAQTEQLRRDVDASNRVLTRIGDVCYGDNPDPTPLDGDPNK
jgi:hypothetical protein